jgi:hypothetical protein
MFNIPLAPCIGMFLYGIFGMPLRPVPKTPSSFQYPRPCRERGGRDREREGGSLKDEFPDTFELVPVSTGCWRDSPRSQKNSTVRPRPCRTPVLSVFRADTLATPYLAALNRLTGAGTGVNRRRRPLPLALALPLSPTATLTLGAEA